MKNLFLLPVLALLCWAPNANAETLHVQQIEAEGSLEVQAGEAKTMMGTEGGAEITASGTGVQAIDSDTLNAEAVETDLKNISDEVKEIMKGNVETKYQFEKGTKPSTPGGDAVSDDDGSGKPSDKSVQYEETSLEFLRDRASAVSVKAVEVRGWDAKKKEEFLGTVKQHAELSSGQDLENFAAGILLKDENIESAEFGEKNIEIAYRMPAKFLGVFRSSLRAKASVEKFGEEISPDKYGRIRVRFPWYRLFYSIPDEVQAGNLEQAIAKGLEATRGDTAANAAQQAARQFEVMSEVMKTMHDTAMSVIRKIG